VVIIIIIIIILEEFSYDLPPRTDGYVVKVKVNFALEQAMKAQRRSRGISLLFL
jgi:hypothetical protein